MRCIDTGEDAAQAQTSLSEIIHRLMVMVMMILMLLMMMLMMIMLLLLMTLVLMRHRQN